MNMDDLSIYRPSELEELRTNATHAFKEIYRTVAALPESDWPAGRVLHLAQLRRDIGRYDTELGARAREVGKEVATSGSPAATISGHAASGETSNNQLHVFISYAREDESFRQELEKHLILLRRTGAIALWHDRLILPGSEWSRQIDDQLELADIVLLLVSPDFFASEYVCGVELKRALERSREGKARTIPILCRPSLWRTSELRPLQALPTDARPISEWPSRDSAWTDVATGIISALQNGPGNGHRSLRG